MALFRKAAQAAVATAPPTAPAAAAACPANLQAAIRRLGLPAGLRRVTVFDILADGSGSTESDWPVIRSLPPAICQMVLKAGHDQGVKDIAERILYRLTVVTSGAPSTGWHRLAEAKEVTADWGGDSPYALAFDGMTAGGKQLVHGELAPAGVTVRQWVSVLIGDFEPTDSGADVAAQEYATFVKQLRGEVTVLARPGQYNAGLAGLLDVGGKGVQDLGTNPSDIVRLTFASLTRGTELDRRPARREGGDRVPGGDRKPLGRQDDVRPDGRRG